MKKVFTRTSFIAFASLAVWGFPGQARAADGGCGGRITIHRKNHGADVLGGLGWLRGRLTGYDKVRTCAQLKPFVPPAFRVSKAEMPMLPAPPKVKSAVNPIPAPAFLAIAHYSAPEPPDVRRKAYVVTLTISAQAARTNGIVPGTFPANYLENQKKDREWRKRVKTVAKVAQTPGGYVCELYLKHAPAKNSAVAVDFENGNSIEVASNMLKGKTTDVFVPSAPKKKRYAALAAAYRVKTPFLLAALRFAAPTLAQGGMGYATMGSLGLVMTSVSLGEGLAMRKLAGNLRTQAAIQNPSLHTEYVLANQEDKIGEQNTRIRTLELQLQSLQKQLETLRQNPTETKTAAKTAQNKRRK